MYDIEMEDFDSVNQFEFCSKVDLHATEVGCQLEKVVAIATEHGFRGIVVEMGRLEQLIKILNKIGAKDIKPIAIIDYPNGASSSDVRNYNILAASEKGATEIEIVAPYHLIKMQDFKGIYEDAQNIMNQVKKIDIGLKYVLDQNSSFVLSSAKTRISRIVTTTKIPCVSTSLGFFDEKISHSDNIIKMREMKNKIGCNIKVYIKDCDVDQFASYIKAGADIIGLEWNKAPYIVHAYEDMVEKRE